MLNYKYDEKYKVECKSLHFKMNEFNSIIELSFIHLFPQLLYITAYLLQIMSSFLLQLACKVGDLHVIFAAFDRFPSLK